MGAVELLKYIVAWAVLAGIIAVVFLLRPYYLPPAHALYYSSVLGTETAYTSLGLKILVMPTTVVQYTLGDVAVYYGSALKFTADGHTYVLNRRFDHVYALTRGQLWVKIDLYLVLRLVPSKKAVIEFYHRFPADSGIGSIKSFIVAVVNPTVIGCVKNVVANLSADEVVSHRSAVQSRIVDCIRSELAQYRSMVSLKLVQVGQMYLPQRVLSAIEQKVAQQQLLQAEKYKAMQKIIQAQAEANATLIRYKALAESLRLLREAGGTELAKILLLSMGGMKVNGLYVLGNTSAVIPILQIAGVR